MQLQTPVNDRDHVLGASDAPLVLVEYADFQCPYSARAFYAVQDLRERLGDQLCLVFRHFPLVDLHPMAQIAAEAAEAAGVQGKFWEMHDALFDYQRRFDEHALEPMAEALDLDLPRFREDMLARRFRVRVEEDIADARQNGARRTPTFFVNGEKHEGDSDEASLAGAIMRNVA